MKMRLANYFSMVAITATVACGGSSSEKAPSTAPVVATGTTSSQGTGTGGATTTGGTLTGTVSALSGTCPALTFKLEGKTIRTNATTSFGDRPCTDVKNDVKVKVVGTAQADGSILATKVGIVPPPPPPVSLTGTVTGLAGTCPALTFKLEGKTIKTNATTAFGDRPCTDVKNDVKVKVAGTAQADGSILATRVGIVPPPPPPPVILTGTVTGLAGACPALTFKLEGRTIRTNATTAFGDRPCTDVKNDVKVKLVGTAQADGSILATRVGIVPPPAPAPVPAITGVVTARAGTCPALTITVGSKSATTTGATVFDGKPCADIKVGIEVAIFGAVPSGGTTLVATKVVSRK